MQRFRASYFDPGGSPKVVWINAPNAASAVAYLEKRGARYVSLLSVPLSNKGRDLQAEAALVQRHAGRIPPVSESTRGKEGTATDLASFVDERLALPAPRPLPTPAKAALQWIAIAFVLAVAAWLNRPRSGATAGFSF